MALTDLTVFSETLYSMTTEITRQQIDLFNTASRGCIQLANAAHMGDYKDTAFFGKISGLARRRNPYGSGAQTQKVMAMLDETMVKVAAGTPPIRLDPGQYKWLQINPEEAAAVLALQLSKDMMADMLNTAIMTCFAGLSGQAALVYDGSAATPNTMNPRMLNTGAFLFGDRASDIQAWVMHSTAMAGFYDNALANSGVLFNYGTINVITDPFGRVFIVTDAPALVTTGSPNKYNTLGLTEGAIVVNQNNDFTDNIQTLNGDENIQRTYQAEWSYQLGLKGFTWDKTNGGKAPNDAALALATNWDKVATSNKDMAGVLVISK